MKATAKAYSNIALVKYWGKKEEGLRLPVNSSLAIGLDKIFTVTTVEFDPQLKFDVVEIDGDSFDADETERVTKHLDIIRAQAQIKYKAKVVTKNNFPKGAGAASSASGFAALSIAGVTAAGLKLSQKELSILARQGSGSASRSIPGGFSIWHTGDTSEESFAESIDAPSDWDLRVLLVFVGDLSQKKVGSTEGMALSQETSPYFDLGVAEARKNLERIKQSINESNWSEFGQVIEDECFRLHTICMTTRPNILYWSSETVAIFQKLLSLREQGIDGFFTVDAGPHVHVVCQAKDVEKIKQELNQLSGIHSIVDCSVGGPAEVIEEHLF